jgi:phosphatidylglycerol:prolipoprotein diacylglycerol transferase
MYPILLQIGPLTIYSLWIFLALGILFSLLVVNKLAKYRLVKLSFLAENSLLIFFCGLILSRLLFIVYNFGYFWEIISQQGNILEIFYIWDKGLSAWGALLGIAASVFLLCRKHKEDFLAWSDILIVSVLFGMVFADIGALLDGRNYGSPTDLPWGVMIEPSQYAIPIHPTQIYAAIYSLLIGLILYFLFNHKQFKNSGLISYMGITLYCLMRFLEELLRGDEANLIFGIVREAQVYSLIGLFFGGYMLYRYFRKYIQENH